MSQRVSLQPAFILHRRPYGDSSLILEAFSRDYGRIALVGKGYRKKRSGNVQAFTPLLLSWTGRGEMKTLTGSESESAGSHLVGRQLYAALYVNEVLLRLLPKADPHPDLYMVYRQLMPALALQPEVEPQLRLFELRLLAELGYGLELTHDAVKGEAIQAQSQYRYVPESGFFPVAGNDNDSGNRFLGADLLAIAAENFASVQVRRAAKRLSRLALAPLLGTRPLLSRELFQQRQTSAGSINGV